MKQVCGYQASDGKFFETEVECEKYELYLKLDKLRQDLDQSIQQFVLSDDFEGRRDLLHYRQASLVVRLTLAFILHDRRKILEIYKFEDEHKQRLEQLTRSSANKKPWWKLW